MLCYEFSKSNELHTNNNQLLGRSSGEGKVYPLQYSGLEHSMDSIVHGVVKGQTQLSDFLFTSLPGRLTACSSVAGGGPRLVRKWGKVSLGDLVLDPPLWVLPAWSLAHVPRLHSCPLASHCPCALLGVPGRHAPAPGTAP